MDMDFGAKAGDIVASVNGNSHWLCTRKELLASSSMKLSILLVPKPITLVCAPDRFANAGS